MGGKREGNGTYVCLMKSFISALQKQFESGSSSNLGGYNSIKKSAHDTPAGQTRGEHKEDLPRPA
jgi:hypothetical protein